MAVLSQKVKTITPSELVCEFELARKMYELEINVPCFFFFIYFPNTEKHFIFRNKTALKTFNYNRSRDIECLLVPAPLSEEVGACLPESHRTWWKRENENDRKKTWFCSTGEFDEGSFEGEETNIAIKSAANEASARTKMLIHLAEASRNAGV